jgi:uncharacterized membrane protein
MEESLQYVTDTLTSVMYVMLYVTLGVWVVAVVIAGWYNALRRNPRRAR